MGNHPEYISAQKICKKLRARYNVTPEKHNISTKITLPNSKAVADVLWNDAKAAFTSLLSDPRIVDSDYLFFGNNPFAPPPSNTSATKDSNTGLACTETCKQRTTKPGKQVLLPAMFHLDGATTGQFSALSIEALKFSLGVFAREARQKDHMWRILGHIPQVAQRKSRGRHVAIDSNHVGSVKPCRCTQHCVLPIRVGNHPPKHILDFGTAGAHLQPAR